MQLKNCQMSQPVLEIGEIFLYIQDKKTVTRLVLSGRKTVIKMDNNSSIK